MITTMRAGNMENNAHIILFTASMSVIVITVWPAASVPDINPANPNSKATSEPEMAVPNFMAIVPDEKMSPVDDVPFFSVA